MSETRTRRLFVYALLNQQSAICIKSILLYYCIQYIHVGDSAGGNMAAALALKLRSMSGSVPEPKLQVRFVTRRNVLFRQK